MAYTTPRTWVAGDVLTAAQLNVDIRDNLAAAFPIGIGGAWTAYTPALATWVTGNGTIAGRYQKVGRIVLFVVDFTSGSTSTYMGTPTVSVPVAADITFNRPIARVVFQDATGAGWIEGAAEFVNTTTVRPYAFTSDGAYVAGVLVTATVPFTWAVGDTLRIRGIYEAAS